MSSERRIVGEASFFLDALHVGGVVYRLEVFPGIESFRIECEETFPRNEPHSVMVNLYARFRVWPQHLDILKSLLDETFGYRYAHFDC